MLWVSARLYRRLLVWVEQADAGAAIFYSPVSGGWKQKLYMLPTGSRPVAMAINETTETLYWVDIGLKEISHAQWNASQPQRLVALEDSQYFSDITLRNGYLYLTDRSGGHIQRIFPGGVNPAFEEMFEGLPAPRAAVAVLKNGLGYGEYDCVFVLLCLVLTVAVLQISPDAVVTTALMMTTTTASPAPLCICGMQPASAPPATRTLVTKAIKPVMVGEVRPLLMRWEGTAYTCCVLHHMESLCVNDCPPNSCPCRRPLVLHCGWNWSCRV